MLTYIALLSQAVSSVLIISGIASNTGFFAGVLSFLAVLGVLGSLLCLCVILFDKDRLTAIIDNEPEKYYSEITTSVAIYIRLLYILFSYAIFSITGNIYIALAYVFIMLYNHIEMVNFVKKHQMNS